MIKSNITRKKKRFKEYILKNNVNILTENNFLQGLRCFNLPSFNDTELDYVNDGHEIDTLI